MRATVCKNLMPEGVPLEKHDDLAGRLNDLHRQWIKKGNREADGRTGVVEGIGCFHEGDRMRSERGLGSIKFRLGPVRHWRRFWSERISPISLLHGNQPGMVVEPHP